MEWESYTIHNTIALARSLAVPRTLMRGIPCACAKIALSYDMHVSLSPCVGDENRALLRHALLARVQQDADVREGLREDGALPMTDRKSSG